MRDAKSPFLRQLFKDIGKTWPSDIDTLSMDPSGDLVVGVSRSHNMYVASIASGKVVPDEPTMKAFHKKMGFLSWTASSLTFGSDGALLVRCSNELQLWSWLKNKLTLTHRAKWDVKNTANFDGPLWCTALEVASLANIDFKKRFIAIWQRAKLPKANSLEGKARETKPARELPLEQELGDVCFALAEDGTAITAEYIDYKATAVSRWDSKGKRAQRVMIDGMNVTDIALSGSHVVLTTSDGELIALDEKLAVAKRVKALPDRAVSVRAAPDGVHVVATSGKELAVFTTKGLKKVAKLAVKALHDFRVHQVTSAGLVITNNPPTLFNLS